MGDEAARPVLKGSGGRGRPPVAERAGDVKLPPTVVKGVRNLMMERPEGCGAQVPARDGAKENQAVMSRQHPKAKTEKRQQVDKHW